MEVQKVVFRRWKDSGDIIALFPEVPADLHGRYADSYEHVGQHGAADYLGVIRATKRVHPDECADFARELTRIGYHLRLIRRASWAHHNKRRQMARQFAATDTG